MVLLLACKFYKQLYAEDETSRLTVVLHVCGAAYHPVTSHEPSGEPEIIMEAQPSQWCLRSDFSMAAANRVGYWLIGFTGSRGRLLGSVFGDHGCSDAGTPSQY